MIKRILAIFLIYCCTAMAWIALGTNVESRTFRQDAKLKSEVSQLWGSAQRQAAPRLYYITKKEIKVETKRGAETVSEIREELSRTYFPLSGSDIRVNLKLQYRKRGLLWYSTYKVQFSGTYNLSNPLLEPQIIFVDFVFPGQGAVYDNFRMTVDGRDVQKIQLRTGSLVEGIALLPRQSKTFQIEYSTQGMDAWWYDFGAEVTQIKNFSLVMKTDFDEINFPEKSISPTEKRRVGGGWELQWKYSNLLSGVTIGMEMPRKLNPGPWVSRITYSAPISLFLFFFLLFILTTVKKVKLHPMNYFFLGASFFSFHLLLAYMVDHISIHISFLIASLVSILLVVSYIRLVAGKRFALQDTGISQFVYLVLFSYTFFFEEYTGLAVTILCVLTLFVVMQITGKVDWENLFHKGPPSLQYASPQRSCPYCRGTLQNTDTFQCIRCATRHHSVCWNEHGGCAIYGCQTP